MVGIFLKALTLNIFNHEIIFNNGVRLARIGRNGLYLVETFDVK